MKKYHIRIWIHIIMISLIVIVLGISAIKLYHWSTATAEISLENINTEDFISESEDFFATADISKIENYQDDGILTVVMLGDASLLDYEDGSGIPYLVGQKVSEKQEISIYNCCFPGATMTSSKPGLDETNGDDAFSFYYTSLCILNDVYVILNEGLETSTIADQTFRTKVQTLEDIDFNKVDVIVLSYGAQDYLQDRYVIPEGDSEEQLFTQNPVIYTDALRQGIEWIRLAYPQIQFIVMSPTFCYFEEENGDLSDCDVRRNQVNANMADYMVCSKIAAVNENVTFLDNYWGIPINSDNAPEYLTESHVYPNAKGRELIAEKLANVLTTKVYYSP